VSGVKYALVHNTIRHGSEKQESLDCEESNHIYFVELKENLTNYVKTFVNWLI